MGWIKPRKPKEDTPTYYDLWAHEDPNSILGRHKMHVPAPKMKLPGHEESYNPPPEYLLSEEEVKGGLGAAEEGAGGTWGAVDALGPRRAVLREGSRECWGTRMKIGHGQARGGRWGSWCGVRPGTRSAQKKKTGKPGSKTQLGTGGALLEMEREVLGWWGASWCLVGQWGTSQGTLGARLGMG